MVKKKNSASRKMLLGPICIPSREPLNWVSWLAFLVARGLLFFQRVWEVVTKLQTRRTLAGYPLRLMGVRVRGAGCLEWQR